MLIGIQKLLCTFPPPRETRDLSPETRSLLTCTLRGVIVVKLPPWTSGLTECTSNTTRENILARPSTSSLVYLDCSLTSWTFSPPRSPQKPIFIESISLKPSWKGSRSSTVSLYHESGTSCLFSVYVAPIPLAPIPLDAMTHDHPFYQIFGTNKAKPKPNLTDAITSVSLIATSVLCVLRSTYDSDIYTTYSELMQTRLDRLPCWLGRSEDQKAGCGAVGVQGSNGQAARRSRKSVLLPPPSQYILAPSSVSC